MNIYTYETIDHKFKLPIKVFLTSINYSISHWHNDYEVILVLRGEYKVTVSSNKKIIKEGDILLINCKEIHEIESSSSDNICLIMQLNELLFNDTGENAKYSFKLDSTNKKIVPKNGINEFRKTAAKVGLVTIQKDSKHIEVFYELKYLIYKFISDLFLYCPYSISTYNTDLDLKTKEMLFYETLKYIDIHYKDEDINQNICKHFGISEKTLYRLIKSYTDQSFKDLILDYKINNSKLLLHNTDKPLDVIAFECGFSSINTFFRQFKNHTEMTPKQYRQKNEINQTNEKIQGYFDFDYDEGLTLLRNVIEEE